jgi:hypothetical protein
MKKLTILYVLKSDKYSGAENVVCQIIDMFRDDSDIKMIYCSSDGEIRNVLQKRNIE